MSDKKIEAFDKTGEELKKGDTVELVYGGDRHVGNIEQIYEDQGSILVVVSARAIVPHGAVRKLPSNTPQPDNSRRRSAT